MGRPRKQGVKRTASGKISRAADSYTEHLDGIALRQRLFGLSEADARDQKAATYIGRLCLAGTKHSTDGITEQQYQVAQAYLRAYESFQRAVKSPDALRTGVGSSTGLDGDEYADWCKAKVEAFRNIKDAIKDTQNLHQNRGANLYAAIDYVLVQDRQLPHLVGDLRIALNAIGHHLGMIPKDKRVAA